jgi:cohesin complex subunit SA-1/2
LFDHSSRKTNGITNDTLAQLKQQCVLEDQEEAILLEVLQASVKHTLLDMNEQLKAPKSKLTKRQKEQLEEEQEEAARELTVLIPKLLNKFGDVPSTAAAVLRIEAVLSIESLQHLRQDTNTYAALLDDVKKQFMSHGTDDVLAPASNAILHAKSYGGLDDLTEEKINGLWEDVVSNLTELLDSTTVTERGVSSFEELIALRNNLLRISRLSAVSDCSIHLEEGSVATSSDDYQGPIDYIIALVLRARPSPEATPDTEAATVEDEIAARAADAALFYFRWKVKNIITAVSTPSGTGLPYEELEALATRRDSYVDNMKAAICSCKPGENVCAALTGYVVELYTSTAMLRNAKPRPGASDDYMVLGMDMDEELQILMMKVFAASEKHFAKLSGKRLEEPAATTNGNGAVDGEDADAMDEDPLSDPESDDEDDEDEHTQTQASQQRKITKALSAIMAEQSLCELTGKIIHAYFASVLADDAAVRTRIERNRSRLGQNYKELIAYLDLNSVEKKQKGKGKARGKKAAAAANGVPAKAAGGKKNFKSNAIVAEDEVDDEIEDEDEEALRRRELVDENEPSPDPEGEDGLPTSNGAAEGEAESVVGD